MKEKVSPAMAGGIIVLVVLVIGGLLFKTYTSSVVHSKDGPPGMPSDAQAEFSKRMGSSQGGVTGPGKSMGSPTVSVGLPPSSNTR